MSRRVRNRLSRLDREKRSDREIACLWNLPSFTLSNLCIIAGYDGKGSESPLCRKERKGIVASVRILFLTSDHLDYVSDPLYLGLSRVLGDDQVVDYPYKQSFHEPERTPWYLIPRPGRAYSREEILGLLADRSFDLVCLASFREECLEEYRQLGDRVTLPPTVFVDGEDGANIRHDVVRRHPIALYLKRDYVWRRNSPIRDWWVWAFHGDRRLFDRTMPLPLSIVMDALPDLRSVAKEIDVSYAGRASHPRRVKAVRMLSHLDGIRFSGGLYASPGDRRYKLKAGALERLWCKLWADEPASLEDLHRKRPPEAYYRELAASRIAVALRGGGRTASLRYFEVVAMGALLVSDPPETVIPDDFVNHHHAVYCRADLRNLPDIIRRYLREDAEREAIITEGRAHLLKYHTCERRADYFVNVCTRML
jgi:hypothetical protein